MSEIEWPDCQRCETNSNVAGADGCFWCFECDEMVRPEAEQ
jgi:tRNA(Ile2) C34 agmatinyltransferase TiaS